MRLARPTFLIFLVSTLSGAELDWSSLNALPQQAGATGAYVTVIDGMLVVAGGQPRTAPTEESGSGLLARTFTRNAFVLDSPEGSWRATTPLPEALGFGASASFGSFAILAGGSPGAGVSYRDSVFRVTFEGDDLVYQPLPRLPEPRAFTSGTMLDGVFYVACGYRNEGTAQPASDMLFLDLQADQLAWQVSSPLPGVGRSSPAMAAQDGALLLFGGNHMSELGATVPLSDSYRFDPGSGWKRIADMPAAAAFAGAIPLGPTHIAVIADGEGTRSDEGIEGGADEIYGTRAVHAYHAVTDTWVSLGDSPAGIAMAGTASWNDLLVVAGGADRPGAAAAPVFAATLEPAAAGFSTLDYAALLGYFTVLVMMGIYFAGKGSSTEDFFLAGRRMPWWATGLSIYGTQLSSISFMAVPAKVFATDWVYIFVQVSIIMVAIPVVFLYLPYFRQKKMTSAYEYLENRFNLPVRLYASLSFVLYQLGRMAIVLFLPAIALSTVTGISVYSCILVMGVLATLYTVMGGMKAVIWTDVVQVFVLYGGALLSLAILVWKLDGGLAGIVSAGMEYDKFHMVNWTWDWTTTAIWVVLVGNFFLNLVPYTSDQAVVQRYFTTKDEKSAARSIWTNAVLLVPSTLTLFLLGTGLWAFYRTNPELLNPSLPPDSIFPLFIAQQLPVGVAGLLIAAIFAASMSTLDSSMNSVSAALVTDFYARFRPRSTDRRRLLLARLITAVLGALATATSIALATFDVGSLWDAFQVMMGLLGGGLAGLFALGIFFRSANGKGAMTGAITSVFILYCVQQYTDLHFFLYGAVGILSCVAVGVLASYGFRDSGRSELSGEPIG